MARPPPPRSLRRLWSLGLFGITILVLVSLAASAAASTSGYDLSYSQSPTTSNPDVSLIHLVTSYSGGPNLTCTFTVAGTIVLSNPEYGYAVYFEGNTTVDAFADVGFGGSAPSGTWSSYNESFFNYSSATPLSFDLSNAGSTLSFSIATQYVGPVSNFSVLADALFVNASGDQFSSLGTASHTTSSSSGPGSWLGIVVTLVVVAAVVVAVAVILWRRRRKPAAASEFV